MQLIGVRRYPHLLAEGVRQPEATYSRHGSQLVQGHRFFTFFLKIGFGTRNSTVLIAASRDRLALRKMEKASHAYIQQPLLPKGGVAGFYRFA